MDTDRHGNVLVGIKLSVEHTVWSEPRAPRDTSRRNRIIRTCRHRVTAVKVDIVVCCDGGAVAATIADNHAVPRGSWRCLPSTPTFAITTTTMSVSESLGMNIVDCVTVQLYRSDSVAIHTVRLRVASSGRERASQ